MLKKVCIYLQSGGLSEVMNYTLIRLKKIFYYKSETIFLYLPREQYINVQKKSDVVFQIIDNEQDLKKLDFDRIKTLNYKKWLKKGSLAIVGIKSARAVSFTWLHFHFHPVLGLGNIALSTEKCWTGPSFVHRSMRGKGVNQVQKHFQINNAPESIKYFLTSVNAKNIASIKSIEKVGFKKGAEMIKYYGIFSTKKMNLIYQNNCESIFQFQK